MLVGLPIAGSAQFRLNMALTIVSKTGRFVDLLPDRSAYVLRQWWKGDPAFSSSPEASRLLSQMHGSEHWMACDCTGKGTTAPLLVPVKRGNTISLRRLSSRDSHARDCAFWSDQNAPAQKESIEAADGAAKVGAMPSFLQAQPANLVVAERQKGSAKQDGHDGNEAALTTMARRLFWLATHAGLQHNDSPDSSMGAVLAAAKHIALATDLSLRDILFCTVSVWQDRWAGDAFERCRKAKVAPQCYWLQPIVDADPVRQTLTFGIGSAGANNSLVIHVEGAMKVFGGDYSPLRFPMLALCRLVQRADGDVVVQQAYAQPILSERRWLLVDSDLERTTYHDLTAICKWLADKHAITVSIEKPLFEWQQTGERPDFVLTVRSRSGRAEQFIVETMGYSDPIYEGRKSSLAARVRVPVWMDRRQGSPVAGEDLRNAVAAWAISKAA
jgi:hypothetical protein